MKTIETIYGGFRDAKGTVVVRWYEGREAFFAFCMVSRQSLGFVQFG